MHNIGPGPYLISAPTSSRGPAVRPWGCPKASRDESQNPQEKANEQLNVSLHPQQSRGDAPSQRGCEASRLPGQWAKRERKPFPAMGKGTTGCSRAKPGADALAALKETSLLNKSETRAADLGCAQCGFGSSGSWAAIN